MNDERATMTVPELAARIGVDESTAYRYLRAGKLPGVQAGASWLIDRQRVERFLAGHEDASGRPLVVSAAPAATLTLLPEPAHDDTALAWRWLHGAHAALGVLLAYEGLAELRSRPVGAAGQTEERGGQRVAG